MPLSVEDSVVPSIVICGTANYRIISHHHIGGHTGITQREVFHDQAELLPVGRTSNQVVIIFVFLQTGIFHIFVGVGVATIHKGSFFVGEAWGWISADELTPMLFRTSTLQMVGHHTGFQLIVAD